MREEPVYEVRQARNHVTKEEELQVYLESKGWKVVDLAYHHVLSESDCRILRSTDSIPSLYYRTFPDFFVTNKDQSMFVELKVGWSPDRAYIEALPLMMNQKRETSFFVPTIYVYAGKITDGEMVATHSVQVEPSKLVIPKRNSQISPILKNYFPCIVEERETRKGTSGDAFVIVDKEKIKKWQPLDDFLN